MNFKEYLKETARRGKSVSGHNITIVFDYVEEAKTFKKFITKWNEKTNAKINGNKVDFLLWSANNPKEAETMLNNIEKLYPGTLPTKRKIVSA